MTLHGVRNGGQEERLLEDEGISLNSDFVSIIDHRVTGVQNFLDKEN